MGGACSIYGGVERCKQSLVVIAERKIPFGRSTRRWDDNIKMNLQKIGLGGGHGQY